MRRCTRRGRSGISTGGWRRRSAPTRRASAGWASAPSTAWAIGVTKPLAWRRMPIICCATAGRPRSPFHWCACARAPANSSPARMGDRDWSQLLCAFRLLFPDAGLVFSTRESPRMRDGLIRLGMTLMSAGSHTEPGGYTGAGRDKLHQTVRGRIVGHAGSSEWAPRSGHGQCHGAIRHRRQPFAAGSGRVIRRAGLRTGVERLGCGAHLGRGCGIHRRPETDASPGATL